MKGWFNMEKITKKEMKSRAIANIENLISITSKCSGNEKEQRRFNDRGEAAIYLARYIGLISEEEAHDYSNRLFSAYCG